MTSIGNMIKRIAGLRDTGDVSDWENKFIGSIDDMTDGGEQTLHLTARQLAIIERIHDKHFAG